MATIDAALSRHRRVGFDTSVFIYHIETSTPQAVPAGVSLDLLGRGTFAGITSVLTLMEIVVKPLQIGRPEVADEYELLLTTFPNLTIANIDRDIARRAAELRSHHRLRPADALQVAACLRHAATAFVTNDKDLRRVTELQVLLLDDFRQP